MYLIPLHDYTLDIARNGNALYIYTLTFNQPQDWMKGLDNKWFSLNVNVGSRALIDYIGDLEISNDYTTIKYKYVNARHDNATDVTHNICVWG